MQEKFNEEMLDPEKTRLFSSHPKEVLSKKDLKKADKLAQKEIKAQKKLDKIEKKALAQEEKVLAKEFFTNHLKEVIHLAIEKNIDLLVMDEVIDAYNLDMVSHDILTEFLKNRPQNLEVVMTGRNPKDEITELADYLTHFQKVKHPFDKGLRARVGIEM